MSPNSEYRKLYRAWGKKQFFSRPMHFDEVYERKLRDAYRYYLHKCVDIIVNNYIHDNMKAPGSNPAKPALFSPSSFNIYFGKDICVVEDGSCVRTAYATGSGSSSIGLDPRYAKIEKMFPELEELCSIVNKMVNRHYERQGLQHFCCRMNHVSVKVYFQGKRTNEHTDIQFDRRHEAPVENNLQIPGTPVGIAMAGDTKYLKFHQYKWNAKGGKDLKGEFVKTKRQLNMIQNNNSLIVLDPRDEYLDKTGTYFWKHSSQLKDERNGVAITLMFRCVSGRKLVHEDGDFVDKTIPGTGRKKKQFDDGWRKLRQNFAAYNCSKEECLLLLQKLANKK